MFLEFWKRKNIRLSFQWEVMDYEKEETIRPEWVATKARVSPITHKLERHVSRAVSITKLIATSWVVFVSILIVLVSVAATIVFRVWAYQSAWPNNPTIATIVSAVLCLAVMMLLANVSN
jgi:K+-transporting ATPase A subunit